MKALTDLPNIGKILAHKLQEVNIRTEKDLKSLGSEAAIIKISSLENGGSCLNMLYALEGAIQDIRWHSLSMMRKEELKEFFHSLQKEINTKT